MYISNNCILPKNWIVETLMKPHKSEPFNPPIANAFYRAGYIEAWGRGVQKICEACRELGTADPEYTVLGDDLTVKFTALESAKISDSKIPKHQDDVLNDVLENRLPSIQRAMNRLKERGRIVRKGGKFAIKMFYSF